MDWVTEHLENQRKAVEAKSALIKRQLEAEERFRNQMPGTWGKILEAIKSDVARLNAAEYSLEVKAGPTMIQVCPEGEIRALVVLELDPTTGRIRYSCPLPRGRTGVPRTGEFQLKVGTTQGHIVGKRDPDGTVETFTAEQLSEFLLRPAITRNA